MTNLAKKYNNPMALIQKPADPWQGLVGATSSGFLHFSTVAYGARAGFINLVNAYFRRGLNTISKIIPVYAPAWHLYNDPNAYIRGLSQITGFAPDQTLQSSDLYRLGMGIARFELGYEPNKAEMDKGFEMAIKRLGGAYMPDSQKKNINLITVFVLTAVGITLAKRISNGL